MQWLGWVSLILVYKLDAGRYEETIYSLEEEEFECDAVSSGDETVLTLLESKGVDIADYSVSVRDRLSFDISYGVPNHPASAKNPASPTV